MEFEHQEALERFRDRVETELLLDAHRRPVVYTLSALAAWDSEALCTANTELLDDVSGIANLYAIFTATRDSATYRLRYLGKTSRALARQRLRNHLFKKDDRTGAKLVDVQMHVRAGGSVQIAWVQVTPESLRNYLEEEFIRAHPEADWNRRAR